MVPGASGGDVRGAWSPGQGKRMKTYPMMLDVRGRSCVVVGAGAVGLRKARALVRAGAKVRLVAAELPDAADLEGIEPVGEEYDRAHLAGALLVFACTDDRAVNARIAADARDLGALVNAADQPEECDFFVPATILDGDVVVAIGTGGACPPLAAALKAELARHVPHRAGEFAEALRSAREHVHRRTSDPRRRRRILKKLAGRAGYKTFIEAGPEGLMQMAAAALEAS